jgi:hypothetical protein
MTQDDPQHPRGAVTADAVLAVVSVRGASISTLGGLLGSETISASDDVIAHVDELQFDLGEGPCWDAIATGLPVQEPDLRNRPNRTWPAFSSALSDSDVAALIAIPLMVGPLRIGAIDLYDVAPRCLSGDELARATTLAGAVSRALLRNAIEESGREEALARPLSRRRIHQATGFVIAQVGVPAADAELLIQARAFVDGRTMLEVADDILTGRRHFTIVDGAIVDES